MELRVEVDGGGEPKALAELHAAAERPAPHVTLAQNIPSPPKTGFPTHQHCPMLLHYAFYFWIVLLWIVDYNIQRYTQPINEMLSRATVVDAQLD
jgi:hypothetical protein